MTVSFLQGFDHYPVDEAVDIDVTNLAFYGFQPLPGAATFYSGTANSNAMRIYSSERRIGGNSLWCRFNPGSGADTERELIIGQPDSTFSAIGCAFKFVSSVNKPTPLIGFGYDSGSGMVNHCWVCMSPTGRISVAEYTLDMTGAVDGTALLHDQTDPSTINASTWFYIEASLDMTPTNPTVKVAVNGVTVINASVSSLFYNQVIKSINNVAVALPTEEFTSDGFIIYYIDDIYVIGDNSGINTDLVGPVHLEVKEVSGAVSADWTPNGAATNWEAVAGGAYDAGDTSYISSTVTGDEDIFSLDDVPTTVGAVVAVTAALFGSGDGGATNVKLKLKNGADTTEGTVVVAGATDEYHAVCFDAAPDGTSAWTRTLFNGSNIAIENIP